MALVRDGLLLTLLIALAALFVLSAGALAHEPSEEVTGAQEKEIQGFLILTEPVATAVDQETAITVEISNATTGQHVSGANVSFVFDLHPKGISERVAAIEREPGHYWTLFIFKEASREWEAHVEFTGPDGQVVRTTFPIEVRGAAPAIPLLNLILGAGGTLFLVGIILYFLSPKKKGKRVYGRHAAVLTIVGIAVVLGISFSVFSRVGAQTGIVVCGEDGRCFWQAHIHSFVIPTVCGEEQRFPTEIGLLSGVHTHEEKNTLHWHDVLPYNLTTQRVINETPLKLGTAADTIGFRLNSTCFYGFCNGDICPGEDRPGTLKAFVNTENYWQKDTPWQQLNEPREYAWKNRDIIYIAFDGRSAEDVRTFLEAQRISFPLLGVG